MPRSALFNKRRPDVARMQRVDANVVAIPGACHSRLFGERADTALAGAVSRATRRPDVRRDRTHVDDCAPTATLHCADRLARPEEDAVKVDRHDALPTRERDVLERGGRRLDDARAVDKDVEAPVPLDDFVDGLVPGALVGDVELTVVTVLPSADMASAAALSFTASTSAITTAAPSLSKRRAMANPIPPAPPVTMAMLPAGLGMAATPGHRSCS